MKHFITESFKFTPQFAEYLKTFPSPFEYLNNGHIGEVVYKLNYARTQEIWTDTTLRVLEGNMSIRKSHYIQNNLDWDEALWTQEAEQMAIGMARMEWSPAGRHLRHLGTDHVVKHGALSINNCSVVTTKESISFSAKMLFTFLKEGAGVGYDMLWDGTLYPIKYRTTIDKEIDDPLDIIDGVLSAYEYGKALPIFNKVRRKRLEELYDSLQLTCEHFLAFRDKTLFIQDIMNIIGVYVVKTHQRRGALLAAGSPHDETFLNLKNYNVYPHREEIGWVSNNSVVMDDTEHFSEILPIIAEMIKKNGEPGIINMKNMGQYGRHEKEYEIINGNTISMAENVHATNPCGEVPLEPYELCNLVTTFPTNCLSRDFTDFDKVGDYKTARDKGLLSIDFEKWYTAVRHATIFGSSTALLMTEHPESNRVIAKNRRIGVAISGLAELFDVYNSPFVIKHLMNGYRIVRETNADCADTAGVPYSKKVTCIKPEGTLGLLSGTPPGIHYPIGKYMIRRIRIRKNNQIAKDLIEKGTPYEDDLFDETTYVFDFNMKSGGSIPIRTVSEVDILEQLYILMTLQRFWADNNVSFTGYFKKGTNVANVIGYAIPFVKTMSLMPLWEPEEGEEAPYAQMPYEEITKEEYMERLTY